MCESRGRVHAGQLEIILLAGATEELFSKLEYGTHVHGPEVEQIFVEWCLITVFFLLECAIAVLGLDVAIGFRFDVGFDRFVLGVGVELFGIGDDASDSPGSRDPGFPAL